MAISIPAILDTQLAALRASMEPVNDAATATDSFAVAPGAIANRCADLLDLLVSLIDSGTLTGVGVHTAADATNTIAVAADATNLATLQTLLNAMRDGTGEAGGGVAAHFLIVGANEHIGADVTNAITAAAATDLATSITLANDIKAQYNGHLLLNAATGHYGPELTNTVVSPDATVLADCITLANELKAKYNLHCANIGAGSLTSFIDNAAITGVNSLVGATFTFDAATTTAALQGVSAVVRANGVNDIQFTSALPAVPVVGDDGVLAWTAVDTDIAAMRQGKGLGDMASNPYGFGPNFINAVMMTLERIGTVPSWLTAAAAEPFGIGSPHAGHGGAQGHSSLILASQMLQEVRDAVAAYTAPA